MNDDQNQNVFEHTALSSNLGKNLQYVPFGVAEKEGPVAEGLVLGRVEDLDALRDQLLVAGPDRVRRDAKGELDATSAALAPSCQQSHGPRGRKVRKLVPSRNRTHSG